MKQLYSARTGLEAHDIRLFLESRGVNACVLGENGLEVGIAFTPSSAPSVFVDDGSVEEASALLSEYWQTKDQPLSTGKWICPSCSEAVEGQFDLCWNCETPRTGELESGPSDEPANTATSTIDPGASNETPSAAAIDDLTSCERFELWLEVAVALCVVWAPYFLTSVIGYLAPTDSVEWPFIAESLWQMSGFVPGVAVILYLIYRGNTPWHVHGLRRPRLVLDTVSGFLIWIASLLAVVLMQRISTLAAGAERWSNEAPSTYGFAIPRTTTDYVMLVVLSIAIGFSEELAMRSYLIPRFERLLRSSAKSVLLSSVLFASYHLYQGFESAFSILFIGLVYGIAFCLTRRFWPVAIAHAMTDFWAISATGMP